MAPVRSATRDHGRLAALGPEAFYDPETFDELYNGPALAAVKRRHDPDERLTTLYDKAVRSR